MQLKADYIRFLHYFDVHQSSNCLLVELQKWLYSFRFAHYNSPGLYFHLCKK